LAGLLVCDTVQARVFQVVAPLSAAHAAGPGVPNLEPRQGVGFICQSARLLSLAPLQAVTAQAADFGGNGATASIELQSDVESDDSNNWLLLPFVSASPETSFAFGVGYLHRFQLGDPEATRSSHVGFTGSYSLNQQLSLLLSPTIYFDENTYRLKTRFEFSDVPQEYYGIGGDTPESNMELITPRSILGRVEFDRAVMPGLYLGGLYEAESFSILESAPNGLFADSAPGNDGGFLSGLGVAMTWDDRDNTWATRHGRYHYLSVTNFGGWLGSDFDFTRVLAETRHFFPAFADHTLALQGYLFMNFGETPFHRMGFLGGSRRLRGFLEGRFRDQDAAIVQAEYRLPVWWRFGLVGFGAVGQAFSSADDLSLDEVKWAMGGGLRFAVDQEERINIRFDVGAGPGTTGFYFNIGEAF